MKYIFSLLLLALLAPDSLPAQCWQSVSAGGGHSLAVHADGTLWAWGYNLYGQLGDSTNADKSTPVQIGTATDWQSVTAGDGHSLALKTDGTVDDQNTPVQIGTAADWQSVAAGSFHSLAVKTDGTLWAWGSNSDGQLGDGTEDDKNSPVQIGTALDWQTVTAGFDYSLALKTDGNLQAWGWNFSGQLGDGTNVSKNSPAAVTCPILPGDACPDAIDIGALFGQPLNQPQTSGLWDNTFYTSDGDPAAGYDCFDDYDGPSLEATLWFSFTGDGGAYRISTGACGAANYIDYGQTQMAVYSGDCANPTPVACNDDLNWLLSLYQASLELTTTPGLPYLVMIDAWAASGAHTPRANSASR